METPKAVETNLHRCPVVGCHSQFSCKSKLAIHLANGCCSPHHPLRHFLDLKMPAAVGFACPACNPPHCSQVFSIAHQHLQTCGYDNQLIHAVAIGGYGCPQCLAIYPTQLQATQHIHDNNHHQIYPQFIGNMTPSSQALVIPVAVIKHLMKTYQAVPWHLNCTTCQINLGPYNNELDGLFKTKLKIKPHVDNGHSLLLDASTDMTDALRILFSKAYTCTRCLCLLEFCPPSQMHHCSRLVTGQVVSVTEIHLQDFLLRFALTSITSVKAENNLRFQVLQQHAVNALEQRHCTAVAQPMSDENNCNNSNSSGFQLEKNNVTNQINELMISNDGTDGEMCPDEENLSDMKEGPLNHSGSQTDPDPSSALHFISLSSESEGSSDSDCMEIPAMSSSSDVLVDLLQSDFVLEVSSDSADNIGENVKLARSSVQKKRKTKKAPANNGHSGISQKVSSLSKKRAASGEICEKPPQIKKPRLSNDDQRQENCREITCPGYIPFNSAASNKPSLSLAQSPAACSSSQPNIFNRVVMSVRKCIDQLCQKNVSFPGDVSATTASAVSSSQSHQCSVGASQGHVNGEGFGLSRFKAGKTSTAFTPGTTASLKVRSGNSSAKITSKVKRPSIHDKQRYFSFKNSAGPSTSRPSASTQQNLVLASANPPKQSDLNKLNSDADLGETGEPQNLNTMNHIIFIDLDNWSKFFQVLPRNLPEKTFVWGFLGGKTVWNEPATDDTYNDAKSRGLVYINKRCGTSKDAADFAICLMVGRTDACIAKHIPFTILSGDRGFEELERQYEGNQRRLVVITPHLRDKDELYVLLKSVAEI